MENDNSVPVYLKPMYDILQCAFPEGVENEDYLPLIELLRNEGQMSFRNIAVVLASVTDKLYIEVYNSVSGFQSSDISDPEEIERVRKRLVFCGYGEWLESSK